jgi:hypothetical protein
MARDLDFCCSSFLDAGSLITSIQGQLNISSVVYRITWYYPYDCPRQDLLGILNHTTPGIRFDSEATKIFCT